MDKVLLTVPEVMVLTGLGRHKVYDLIRSGALPSAKVGRDRRIRRVDLEEFAARLVNGAAA